MEQLSCSECGQPIRRDNKVGICNRTPACRVAYERRRLELNPDKLEARNAYARQYHADHKDERAEYHLSWRRANIKTIAVASARSRAKHAGVPCEITVESLPDIPEVCPVLGIPLEYAGGGSSPSLDRIKPELGYVPGNVHWISLKANRIKNDATVGELFLVADYFRRLEDGTS